MTVIKAIPATYTGIEFRSRLEARWAVFMDMLGVEWLYEYEGYQLPSGWYVPDYFLPKMDSWLEIKPKTPTDTESSLAIELCEATQKRVLVCFDLSSHCCENNSDSAHVYKWYGEGHAACGDQFYHWCACPVCGKIGIEFEGRGGRVCGYKCVPQNKSDRGNGRTDEIETAFETARTFKFW